MDSIIKIGSATAPLVALAILTFSSYLSVVRQRGLLVGVFVILLLAVYGVSIEAFAIKANLPFGNFIYDEALGYKLFGTIPWIIALAYPAFVLTSFWLASYLAVNSLRIWLAGFIFLLISLSLEPAMASMGLRQWESEGLYFGVPLIAFVGWVIAALIASAVLHVAWPTDLHVKRHVAFGGMFILLFWTGVNASLELWIPAGLSGALALMILAMSMIEKWKLAREP